MTNEDKRNRIVTFRANEFDNANMEACRLYMGEGIRKVTDADIIREGMKLILIKKNLPREVEGKRFKIEGGIPHIDGVPQAVMVSTQKEIPIMSRGEELSRTFSAPSLLVRKKENSEESREVADARMTANLSPEELMKGYQYLRGELCDKDGYPVEELGGDVIVRGGEVYVIDPGRKALKEQAAENSAKELSVETPVGRMNPQMADLLKESPKLGSVIIEPGTENEEVVERPTHSAPGMLTTEYEGVDEVYDEEPNGDFIG